MAFAACSAARGSNVSPLGVIDRAPADNAREAIARARSFDVHPVQFTSRGDAVPCELTAADAYALCALAVLDDGSTVEVWLADFLDFFKACEAMVSLGTSLAIWGPPRPF